MRTSYVYFGGNPIYLEHPEGSEILVVVRLCKKSCDESVTMFGKALFPGDTLVV